MASFEYERVPRSQVGLGGYSTRELASEFIEQGQRLVREEVRLARAEFASEAREAAKAGALSAASAAVGYCALLVLAFCLVFALATAMNLWLAALIVGVVLAIAAAGLFIAGRKKLQKVSIKPEQTIATIEEDRRWARETMRGAKSRMHASA